jgi:hypothetical protein
MRITRASIVSWPRIGRPERGGGAGAVEDVTGPILARRSDAVETSSGEAGRGSDPTGGLAPGDARPDERLDLALRGFQRGGPVILAGERCGRPGPDDDGELTSGRDRAIRVAGC